MNIYTPQQACYAIALGIFTNFFFKSNTIYLVIFSIYSWFIIVLQSFSYFAYNHLNNGKLPRRMASLNQLWLLCFIIWRQRQILELADPIKLNCFYLSWLLGAVYLKNKIVLLWNLFKSKTKTQ